MYATSASQREGVAAYCITGGRPRLKDRPTKQILDSLASEGIATAWVLSDRDADVYERDEHEMIVYPRTWALDYATAHWLLPTPPEAGTFLGAFPGREYACVTGETRGYRGVLQLDDNIRALSIGRGGKAAYGLAREHGPVAFLDLLAAVTYSTNARMVGAQLEAVNQIKPVFARPGFPYSFFIEQLGKGREHWNGPYEDDITHALQYGRRADGATAALLPILRYNKESKSKTGMRSHYDHTRSVQLQRCFPEAAKITIRRGRANGRGEARVFHQMQARAIQNRLRVTDPDLYRRAGETLTWILSTYDERRERWVKQKVAGHVAKHGHTPR